LAIFISIYKGYLDLNPILQMHDFSRLDIAGKLYGIQYAPFFRLLVKILNII